MTDVCISQTATRTMRGLYLRRHLSTAVHTVTMPKIASSRATGRGSILRVWSLQTNAVRVSLSLFDESSSPDQASFF